MATSGGPGIVGDSCSDPVSAVPGPTPAVLPPTKTVQVSMTVTNCGTVLESGVVVSQTLTPVGAGRLGGSPRPASAAGRHRPG